jgi:hypothetical protein
VLAGAAGRQRSGIATVHVDRAAVAPARALQRPQQRRLARAVAPHQRADLPAPQVDVDLAHRDDVAVPDHHPTGDQRGRAPDDPQRHRRRPGQPLAQLGGAAAGVAHRQRQRLPAGQPAELDHRGRHRAGGQHDGRLAVDRGAVAGQVHHAVGVLQHPLEPVLGHEHRDAEVVHQPGDGGQHLLGGAGVQRRGRLVEHQHPRVGGEDRADRDPLLLPPDRSCSARPRRSASPAGRAPPRPGCA